MMSRDVACILVGLVHMICRVSLSNKIERWFLLLIIRLWGNQIMTFEHL